MEKVKKKLILFLLTLLSCGGNFTSITTLSDEALMPYFEKLQLKLFEEFEIGSMNIKIKDIEEMKTVIQDNYEKIKEQKIELNETRARLEEQKLELEKTQLELEQLKLNSEVPLLATAPENCGEAADLGIKASRMITLDPDGQNVKEEAFQAFCEIPAGRTILDEDVQVQAQNCDGLHCFEHSMNYSAPLTQIVELIESSGNCSQLINVECISAPFQFDDEVLFQWTDRHGTSHPLPELGNSQCNLKASRKFVDEGIISNNSLLPILGWSYGPLQFEGDELIVTIGSLVCDRKVHEIDEKSLKATVKEHDKKLFKIETENRQFQTDLVSQREELEATFNATEENILNESKQKSEIAIQDLKESMNTQKNDIRNEFQTKLDNTENSCKQNSNQAIQNLKTIIGSKETSIRSDFQTKLIETENDCKQRSNQAIQNLKTIIGSKETSIRNEFQTKLTKTETDCKQNSNQAIQDLETIIDTKETSIRSEFQTKLTITKTELQEQSKEAIETFETKMNTIHNENKNEFQRDLTTEKTEMKIKLPSLLPCTPESSTATTAFREIEGKCYYIQLRGCPDGDGCTYEEAKTLCKTVFTPSSGKVFEPTSLQTSNAVLKAAKDALGSWSFWVGVTNTNGNATYKSNNEAVSFGSIPWYTDHSSKSNECVCVNSGTLKWSTSSLCSSSTMYTICEATF